MVSSRRLNRRRAMRVPTTFRLLPLRLELSLPVGTPLPW